MPAVLTRQLGARKELLPKWDLPLPPEAIEGGGGDGLRLRDLIERIVRLEVAAFRKRQKQNRTVTVLTEAEIRERAGRGRVLSGGSDIDQPVDLEQAIAAALVAFEDGMYLVLIDGDEKTDLDQRVFLTEDSTITFLRLTFLAGGF